jgi:hypothetical protein
MLLKGQVDYLPGLFLARANRIKLTRLSGETIKMPVSADAPDKFSSAIR